MFKEDDQATWGNYTPIAVLSAISKVYDRLMFEQIVVYTESFLFNISMDFAKATTLNKLLFDFSRNASQ